MSAEADAICGAPYGERSAERTDSRNGYRTRDFDTRAGTMAVAIPKLREGSYFPDWLLERRRRAERALSTVVATCYLLGVSTGRMEKLVETLGITRLSKSQVSVMAKELDAHVEDYRTRPLGRRPVHVRGCGRVDDGGPRGRPGGGHPRPGRHPAALADLQGPGRFWIQDLMCSCEGVNFVWISSPVTLSIAAATTDGACTSSPTLVRSVNTGASHNCRTGRAGDPCSVTHEHV
jgi:putative transposase